MTKGTAPKNLYAVIGHEFPYRDYDDYVCCWTVTTFKTRKSAELAVALKCGNKIVKYEMVKS